EIVLFQNIHRAQCARPLIAMRGVDHDRQTELLRQLDLRTKRLVLGGRLLIIAELTHGHDALLDEKARQFLKYSLRERLVVRLLGIEANGAVMANSELSSAEALESSDHGKVVAKTSNVGPWLPQPECRFDDRDDTSIRHRRVVIRRSRNHVGVRIN